jgi:SNF2 family DNA or RNA helicase
MNTQLARQEDFMTLQDLYRRAGAGEDVPRIDGITIHPDIVPMPHQLGDLNNALREGKWGLFSSPGVGKTFPAQAWAVFYAAYGVRVVLLMPPVLIPQFKNSLLTTFQGVENAFSLHTLTEPPYPVRLTKKKVQDARRAIHLGEKVDLPPDLLDYIVNVPGTFDVAFRQHEIDQIRASSAKADDLAKQLGCSVGAIQQIRRTRCREDLFAEWKQASTWPDLLMMSYQMFFRVNKVLQPHYGAMVADEAHNYLCHPGSTTFMKVRNFVLRDKEDIGFVPMTGTPDPNLPSDLYGLIKLINPKAYGSYADFENLHVEKVRTQNRTRNWEIILDYKNLDTLRINLFAHASRVTKEQVFTLDKPQVIEVDVELGKEHLNLYRKLVRERVLEVNGEMISAVQAQSLRQKALQIITNPDPFSNHPIKENSVRDMLAELLVDLDCLRKEKVVIYGIYNNSIEAMAEWFKEYNPALVYGRSDTVKNVEKFLKDDTCRLMLAHYKSGGVGLNLQDVCRYVICAEPTSVPGEFIQATERVYRKGQKKVVSFYILKVLRTGWPKQVEAMKGKLALSRQISMDKSALLRELLGDE